MDSASEAVMLAQRHGLHAPKDAFSPELLLLRAEVAQGQRTTAQALQELNKLRSQWTKDDQQAALDYTVWQIDSTCEAERLRSIVAYERLYARTHTVFYRACYQNLSGQTLPDPPTLPDLPLLITEDPPALPTLLAQVDQMCALVAQTTDSPT